MDRLPRRLLEPFGAMTAAAILLVACGPSGEGSPITAPAEITVSCEPALRFRLGDIEYENERFDEQVPPSDLGPVVGSVKVLPAAIARCERVSLQDGEGSLPAGTKIYAITGVEQSVALAATVGNDLYLKYVGKPVP